MDFIFRKGDMMAPPYQTMQEMTQPYGPTIPTSNPTSNPVQPAPKTTEVELMPVRETLNKQFGIDNKRIGYNPNTGYVTIDNTEVLKPTVNREGTTYAGQDLFNSAQGQINTLNNAYNLQQQVLNPQQSNPYDNQLAQLLQQIQQRTMNPVVIDQNAALMSPQYAAFQAQAQRDAQQATRQAQEALGGAHMSRGTRLQDRAQNIQNEAKQFLQLQALPQVIAQLQAQEDARTRNLYDLLGALGQQQGLYDTRNNQQFDRAASVLNFLAGRQDRAQDVDYRDRQFDYGQQIDQRDFDYRSERDQVSDERYVDERDYQRWRDSIKDEQYKQQFDEDTRRYGLDYALRRAAQANQISNTLADNQRIAENQRIANLYDIWDRTGSAPEGIPGVEAGTPLMEKTSSSGQAATKIDAKSSADNYDLLLEDLQTEGVTKETARQLVEANKDYLTDSDYKKLREYINETW